MSAPSTSFPSTASLFLASGRLPRFQFQSLRAPTKPPYRSPSPSCPWLRGVARTTLLAPISASALPLQLTAAPRPVVEAEVDPGRRAAAMRVAVALACGALASAWCLRALAVGAAAAGVGTGASGAVEAAVAGTGAPGAVEAAVAAVWAALRGSWPTVLQILQLLKEQGLVLTLLLGLSAFFSMAETSITTLWPWKVRAHLGIHL